MQHSRWWIRRAVAVIAATILGAGAASAIAAPAGAAPATGAQSAKALCARPAKPGRMQCFAMRRAPTTTTRGVTPDADLMGYGPADIASAYNLPASGGAGVTVAIVDAYDDPSAESDLAVYRQQWGLPPCSSDDGCFTKIDQRGGTSYPVPDPNWAGEISLDLDAVSAVCTSCHILLVEADSNSVDDLGAAVDEAVARGAKVVSNSYGGPEDPQLIAAAEKHYHHPGVAITASSGDYGYGVSYPASSPYVTSVGGTSLNRDSSTPRGWSEQVWHNYTGAPGSGCSAVEDKPYFQQDTGCAKRTVADVSAVADPITGLAVYQTYGGYGWSQFGGTSLAAPVIAAIYALAGPTPANDLPNWYPYAATSGLNDVTDGTNGRCDSSIAYLCTAGSGYDGPTGLGTPDGITAFEAPGPHGNIAGAVSDSADGAPIADATVHITGTGVDASAITDAQGRYQFTELVGDYDLALTAFGHDPQSRHVTVADGQTTAADFALTPRPLVTLTGEVRDGSGHGWPLYAKVTAPGTPLPAVYTDPYTGRYTMRVPAGSTFSLHALVTGVGGYQPADQPVSIGSADTSQDVAVPVDAEMCDAPGYEHRYAGLPAEGFESSSAPTGWTIQNGNDNGGWEFDQGSVLRRTNQTIGSGNFALADTEIQDYKDTTLTTPPVDLTGVNDPVVGVRSYYVGITTGQQADIDVSIDDGATWTTLWSPSGPWVVSGPLALPIPQAAGHSGVLVKFHYQGQYSRYWELDDVYVGTRTCSPIPGGMVSGLVVDANTGDGVDGATVSGGGLQDTSVATPDDDGVGDGYYALFASGSGDEQFTASARDRVSATRSIQVTPDAVTRADFSLPTGRLAIDPGSITQSVQLGDTGQAKVQITNTGSAPAQVRLVEQPGGVAPLDSAVATTPTPTRRVPAQVATGPRIARGEHASAGAPAASANLAGSSWLPVTDYPAGRMMDDAMARGDDGTVYVVGGTPDGYGPSAAAYAYDPTRLLWTQLPDLPVPVQQPATAFIGGKLIVAGGWGSSDAVTTVQIYDQSTRTWSAGAPMPAPRAAAGSAVVDGKLYVVSGCDPGDCVPGPNTVFVYDPVADQWSQAANYPASEAFLSCGGVEEMVVCAGGLTASSGDGSSATYAYSPRTDTWTRKPDLPTGWWGAATATANGELLMSGGVNGPSALQSAVTNQGYAYEAASGTWNPLPNAPAPFYRGAATCGMFRVGGATDHFNAIGVAQELPGYDMCGASGDVSWLGESATAFTLQPGQSDLVTLTLDAAAIDQPGDYTAQVAVRLDAPGQPQPLAVTMHVTPPKTWGKLTGTVSGADCSGVASPLSRATVSVQTKQSTLTLWTAGDGSWSAWVDKRDNPVTLVFSKDGYGSVVRTVKADPRNVVDTDVVLTPARC